jgi:muconolactone delta-isomerase
MKFLLTVTPRRLQMPPAAVIDQSSAWITARLKDKTADVVYGFVTGGGISIMNADSGESLMKLLMSYPGFPFVDFKVEPLCDIHAILEQVKAMTQRAVGQA